MAHFTYCLSTVFHDYNLSLFKLEIIRQTWSALSSSLMQFGFAAHINWTLFNEPLAAAKWSAVRPSVSLNMTKVIYNKRHVIIGAGKAFWYMMNIQIWRTPHAFYLVPRFHSSYKPTSLSLLLCLGGILRPCLVRWMLRDGVVCDRWDYQHSSTAFDVLPLVSWRSVAIHD